MWRNPRMQAVTRVLVRRPAVDIAGSRGQERSCQGLSVSGVSEGRAGAQDRAVGEMKRIIFWQADESYRRVASSVELNTRTTIYKIYNEVCTE